jgi:hypothetical protein
MLNSPVKILAFSAVVEVGTGLVLIFDPAFIVRLLLDANLSGVGIPLARCFGVALLALGVAAWSSAFRAMLLYNALIASYLAYLGAVAHVGGLLLWPAVALHAVVALLLGWTLSRRSAGRAGSGRASAGR